MKEQDIDEVLARAEKMFKLADNDAEMVRSSTVASFFLLSALLKEVALLRQDLARTGVSRS